MTGTIANRLQCPNGGWYDHEGDLYVADVCENIVVEYNPGQTGAAWIYSSGLFDPINVTTDKYDNVYVAAANGYSVTEFAHRTNTVLHQCQPGPSQENGVAVDGSGNVFVSIINSPLLYEFKGGLGNGCVATSLGITFSYPVQMVIDKNGNLLAGDQGAGRFDIIAPPYTSITRSFTPVFGKPYRVALNPQNNLVFVVDTDGYTEVLTYPRAVFYDLLYDPPYDSFGVAAD